MIRTLAKTLVRSAVVNDWSWRLIERAICNTADYARWERTKIHDPEAEAFHDFNRKFAALISPDLRVKHGPFQGMQYVEGGIVCGPFIPRLLGSYERELHSLIEQICATSYSQILDVGCAEGYYAVGLARRIPSAKVYAYDTSLRAQTSCQQMAAANNVASRVTIHGFCSPESLSAFPFEGRGLVVCDCEGFEATLFTPAVARALHNCDVLVELHDILDAAISSQVLSAFSRTHRATMIESIDDTRKAKLYDYPEITRFDLSTRKCLVSEGRGGIMEWAFFTPQENS